MAKNKFDKLYASFRATKLALFLSSVIFSSILSLSNTYGEIKTQTLDVKVIRVAKSMRVYQFETDSIDLLQNGKILLIKEGTQNVMGLKVIKSYPEKRQVAARRVSLYPGFDELEVSKNYSGLVKIGDLSGSESSSPDSAEDTKLDTEDLGELESALNTEAPSPIDVDTRIPEILPYDPELDAGTSPPPDDGTAVDPERDDQEEDQLRNIIADEVRPLDSAHQWLTGQFGAFLNRSSRRNYTYFGGVGGRYGVTLGKMLFLKGLNAQDSISLECGVFAFKVVRFMTDFDSYYVMPVVPTLRYNMNFGENWIWFFYGGVRYNVILAATDSTALGLWKLNTLLPAVGTGVMYQFGPKWFARADIGLEMLAFGLTLKF
jgi:hypothetical protein